MQKNKLVVLNLFKFLDKQDYWTIEPYLGDIQKIVQIILGQHDTQDKENKELQKQFNSLSTEDRKKFLNPEKIKHVKNVFEKIRCLAGKSEPKNRFNINNMDDNISNLSKEETNEKKNRNNQRTLLLCTNSL